MFVFSHLVYSTCLAAALYGLLFALPPGQGDGHAATHPPGHVLAPLLGHPVGHLHHHHHHHHSISIIIVIITCTQVSWGTALCTGTVLHSSLGALSHFLRSADPEIESSRDRIWNYYLQTQCRPPQKQIATSCTSPHSWFQTCGIFCNCFHNSSLLLSCTLSHTK